jgi:flavin reductase ActVB
MSPGVESLTGGVDADQFRDAMALLAAPLTVVTTVDTDGAWRGFTASAVMPVSQHPPIVLVGVSCTSSCYEAVTLAGEFVINVLGDRHQQVARTFATHGIDRFAGADFGAWPDSDLPCLTDANVALRCANREVVPVGDHVLLLGTLVGVRIRETGAAGRALVWYRRAFHSPG